MLRSGPGHYPRRARYREFFGLVHQILPLAASGRQITDDAQIDGRSDFLVHARAATFQDGQAKVRFERVPGKYDASTPYYISSLGSGQYPIYYAQPLVIVRGTTYRLWADDRQTVPLTNNLRVLHIGQKVFPQPFESARLYTWAEPFRLIADFTVEGVGALAANQTGQAPLSVQAEYDFDVLRMLVLSDGPVTVDVVTTGKAMRWFSRPCHSDLVGGTGFNAATRAGEWPFRLPSPVRVPASGVIDVSVADLSGVANRVQVLFDGISLMPPGGLPITDAQIDRMGVGAA